MGSEGAKLEGVTILLVEDHEDIAQLLALTLESYGAQVRCARDGAAALAQVEADRFDVAVVDLGLPDMNGRELARELRKRGAAERIFALSGYDDPGDTPDLFDRFLQKPIGAAQIAAVINGQATAR